MGGIYICLRCKYSNSNKFNFRKHLLKKNVCKVTYRDIDVMELVEKLDNGEYEDFYKKCVKEIKCLHCDRYYSNKSNMLRHAKNCKKTVVNEYKITNIQHNNYINNVNNVNIQVNSLGNETFNIKEITEKLKLELNYSDFNGNKLDYGDRVNNLIDNYGIIFDNIYDNPDNHNFSIVNKRKKICKIKEDEIYKHINFEDLTNKIYIIINNIFDLAILEFELNNDQESLYHYREFKQKLISRRELFIEKYNNATSDVEKKNIYNSFYQYYSGFKDILNNIKDKIIVKAYDINI